MQMSTNSGAAYGTVIHHAIGLMEREIALGTPRAQALQIALENFVHYWHPMNISTLCDPVPPDGWLRGQSYGGLREKGIDSLRRYAELLVTEDTELLATEYGFQVPIPGTWDYDADEPHILAGSVDRLGARFWRRQQFVAQDDYKSGKEYINLRQNLQGTAYCMASTLPEFWTGWRGEDGFGPARGKELFERFDGCARKFTWINLRDVKFEDGGWRGPKDYQRFAVACEQFAALVKADIYPLSISGSVCRFCDARKVCAGTGLPDAEEGAPTKRA